MWRPLLGRLVPYAFALAVLAFGGVFATTVPPTVSLAMRALFVVICVLVAAGLRMVGRCRLTADERGLTVVNIASSRRLEWAEVIGVSMEVGASWPTFDLADGSVLAVMGIQASDGARARRALAELRTLLDERSAHEPGE